ncbi:MAG: hypothetical protein EAZ85_07360 [Bacteroidetes bacterium]|nr:MAG: hypothetical protein EAZ85_07360 [Bacteroidota bacterium]TAG89463.1 MAG: hypothetical protein EAZ20_06430 [Bacteroidota bacterium]
MKNKLFLTLFYLISVTFFVKSQDKEWLTTFEISEGKETFTYQNGINFIEKLTKKYPFFQLKTIGNTDIGKPLHVLVYSLDKDFEVESLKKKEKNIIFINNAIHPGEPDGVDATLMLMRDIAQKKELQKITENTVIVVIPFYNIDGVLRRNSTSRANQNGPKEYGFRGNAKNLDLNRDFIKLDSENAQTFTQIFQQWKPDIFLDNHVTNGADYQYIFTCLITQPQKLGSILGEYLTKEMYPDLEKKMKSKNFEMMQYVNVHNFPPDSGFVQFLESPRYSTGYAALFQTIGFVPETHMLKDFAQRVKSNYEFMVSTLEFLEKNGKNIQTLRKKSLENIQNKQKYFVLDWKNNQNNYEMVDFKGYEAKLIKSKITQKERLFYDKNKKFTKKVKFYNQYEPSITIEKPKAYIVPKAYKEVLKRLELNGVKMEKIKENQKMTLQVYYIDDFKTLKNPFENHYLHYQTKIKKEKQTLDIEEGDFLVYANQISNRYIIETLEPEAPDSFFNWNFFDGILQQKESYSSYVFEETAEKLLAENKELKQKFEEKKKNDKKFAENPESQLDFLYQNSPYYEKSHLRYPIFRLE